MKLVVFFPSFNFSFHAIANCDRSGPFACPTFRIVCFDLIDSAHFSAHFNRRVAQRYYLTQLHYLITRSGSTLIARVRVALKWDGPVNVDIFCDI